MNERDEAEQFETFNEDQQEMFQPPDTNLGETRPRTPGAQNVPPTLSPEAEEERTAGVEVWPEIRRSNDD